MAGQPTLSDLDKRSAALWHGRLDYKLKNPRAQSAAKLKVDPSAGRPGHIGRAPPFGCVREGSSQPVDHNAGRRSAAVPPPHARPPSTKGGESVFPTFQMKLAKIMSRRCADRLRLPSLRRPQSRKSRDRQVAVRRCDRVRAHRGRDADLVDQTVERVGDAADLVADAHGLGPGPQGAAHRRLGFDRAVQTQKLAVGPMMWRWAGRYSVTTNSTTLCPPAPPPVCS